MATSISIDEAVSACKLAGNGMVPGKAPMRSELKTEASLVGLAYLNYIYQNDIANQHFCEAMLLMHAQVPEGTPNPYVALFTQENARPAMAALATFSSLSTTPSSAPTRPKRRSQPRSPPCGRSSRRARRPREERGPGRVSLAWDGS